MDIRFKTKSLFCLGVFLLGFNVSTWAQKVSLNYRNVKVEKVLSSIKSQTGMGVVYSDQIMDVNRKISIQVEKAELKDALNKILDGTNVTYEIKSNKIYFVEKQSTSSQKVKKVKGIVRTSDGEPIIGANIVVIGDRGHGVITDIDGKFSLDIPQNGAIEVSYLGYLPKTVYVKGSNYLDINLREDLKSLDEVVVIGYGTQKKSDLTGSVASVSSEDLNTSSNLNIGQAIQGKMAGVDIVSRGGDPGAGTRILIRGLGTLNNSNPLYIIDGMYMNNMDFVNPNDVKSISVLKDASASAIYGSRAANGVVIIETKSGSNTQGKPVVKVTADMGAQIKNKKMDMLNAKDWAELSTLARKNSGLKPYQMAVDVDKLEDNDWQDIMLRAALQQNYNVSLTGGSDYFTYYASLGYKKQEGIIRGTDYDRFNATLKATYKRSWFSAGTNVLFSMDKNNPVWGGGFNRGGSVGAILEALPCMPLYDENNIGGYGGNYGDASNTPNPMASTDRNIYHKQDKGYNTFFNLYAQLNLPWGLKYKLSVNPNFSFYDNYTFQNIYEMGICRSSERSMSRSNSFNYSLLVENTLSFDKEFKGGHKVNALIGYSYQTAEGRFLGASGKYLPAGIYEIDATTASSRGTTGNSVKNALTSILGRVFYSYKDKYFLTATFRRDGSSRFAHENHYGTYPSFSLGYNIAKENFMSSTSEWLNELKLRGGYGVLGNQEIGDYTFASVVTPGINYPNGNGGVNEGAYPTDFANPGIKWEKTSMVNIGLDFAALDNRLTGTLEWYNKNTDDILIAVPIPPSTGAGNDPVRNAGKISNKGFEFLLGWKDHVNHDFSYNVSVNGSFVKNNVERMGTGDQILYGNGGGCRTLAGYPIGGFWLVQTDGLFQSEQEVKDHSLNGKLIQPFAKPGDQRYIDANNDGQIDDNDKVYMGNSFPKFSFGTSFGFTYKNFDFKLDLQGSLGYKLFNQTKASFDMPGGANGMADAKDYWSESNRDASHPRLQADDPNHNYWGSSSRYLEDASYLRIRNIEIGYNFPTRWFKNYVKSLRIYANVENLLTFTSYSGYTPDVTGYDVLNRGWDRFAYPATKVFMGGINLTF